jgi:hypothetical protein
VPLGEPPERRDVGAGTAGIESGGGTGPPAPEGIVMKYPQLNRYPVWGSPVPRGDIDFEFTVNNDLNEICECELYIDGNLEKTFSAASGAHMEVTPNEPVPQGDHNWQVICDEGRIVGPVTSFFVEADVPVKRKSFGGTKRSFHGQ